ncbi:MAG TPA: hypothetical protein VNZ57_03505, partial [Longimicrobiales bacterium]|nr:hypothetical protein [Longimicrobiales bacterium]
RRYKVYIIDEAHMLTREAWNALLKVLEEPPPRVVFVFATTEPQKIQQVAAPVLSRCQRFDFRRMTTGSIVETLRNVLAAEGIEAGDDALVPIARHAEGGMRDALSLLDQVLALADRKLTGDDVRRVLGLVDDEVFLELFQILADRRHADVFAYVDRLIDQGYDLAEYYRALTDALRTLLMVKLDGAIDDIREDLREAYVEVAGRFATGDLVRMLAQAAELDTDGRFRKSANPRIALELLLLRFAYMEHAVEIEDVIRALGGQGNTVGYRPEPGRIREAAPVVEPRMAVPAGGTAVAKAWEVPASASEVAPPHVVQDVRPDVRDNAAVAGAGAAPPEVESPEAALRALLDSGNVVPAGLRSFLRAARISEPEPGRLVIDVPPGPGWERLSADTATRIALQEALASRTGRQLTVELRAAQFSGSTGDVPVPMTPERLRREKLEKLRREPGLGAAIEAWDLELID